MANRTQEVLIANEVVQVKSRIEWANKLRKTHSSVSRSMNEGHSAITVVAVKWRQEAPTEEFIGHAEGRSVWVAKVRTTHGRTKGQSHRLVEVRIGRECMASLGLSGMSETVTSRVQLRNTQVRVRGRRGEGWVAIAR